MTIETVFVADLFNSVDNCWRALIAREKIGMVVSGLFLQDFAR
jgi:hypothetical protein